jgi:hypothetical protein
MKFNKNWLWLIIPVLIFSLVYINSSSVSTVLLAIQGAITDGNLVKFSGTNGIGVDTGLSSTNVVKCKFDATSAPTVDNDVDEGYTVGSSWYDITNDKEYICLDNADGAAVWIETTAEGDGATTFTGLTDTPANYTGQAGKYTKVNAEENALEFDVPAGAGDMTKAVYDIDTDNIVDKAETVDDGVGNSSTAADVKDAVTKKHSQNTDADLDATFEATFVKKADTINVLSDITSPGADIEDAVTKKHSQNADTALGTQTQDLNMGTHKIIGVVDPVNPQEAATKAYADTKVATEVDPTVDSDAKIKAILVDEVTKTGAFTAGRMAVINNASGIIEQGTNTDTEVTDAVTKKHTAGTDTTLGTLTADVNMGTHKLTGLSVPSAVGESVRTTATITEANLEDAISKKHTQNTDTQFDFYNALSSDHDWSGDKDTQPVGESVVFGDLLYPDWTAGEWLKADADLAAKMPGLRIALESKTDGQTCLMLVKGYIRDDSAFEFTASMVYANVTPGTMSSTAPSAGGQQLQRVGVAKSADILFFDPSIDVGEIKP